MSNISRRAFQLGGLISLTGGSARSEDYPQHNLKMVSIHPVGITTDLLARVIAPRMGEVLGQSVVVENRAGGNGMLAAATVAKGSADGYQMLITSSSHVANAHLQKNLSYDTLRDFSPITELCASYGLVLITNLPANSVAELVNLGKKRQLSYATNGAGNTTHIAGLLLEKMAGIQMNAVPYSTNSMITDVLSGVVDFMFVGTVNAAPLVEAGKVKALATTGQSRSKLMPTLPTFQELGFKGFDVSGYFGLLFPIGTAMDRVRKVHAAAVKALVATEVKAFLDASDYEMIGSTPEEFKIFLEKDYAFQDNLLQQVGLK